MKRSILFFTALFSLSAAMADTSFEFGKGLHKVNDAKEVGIKFFDGTWSEALAEAKKENKLIFMDAYASWCGPCKMMSANTFTDESVGTYFNEHFVNFKMDMEKHAEGPRLSSKYGLTAYPTLYFVNSDEKVVHQSLGYQKPDQLIAVGEAAVAKK